MKKAIIVDEEDVTLLVNALRMSLTWTLDAIGDSIVPPSTRNVRDGLAHRARIRDLLVELDCAEDDSYRMGHLLEYAERMSSSAVIECVRKAMRCDATS